MKCGHEKSELRFFLVLVLVIISIPIVLIVMIFVTVMMDFEKIIATPVITAAHDEYGPVSEKDVAISSPDA